MTKTNARKVVGEGPNVTYTFYVNANSKDKLDKLVDRAFITNKTLFFRALIHNLADAPDSVVQVLTGAIPSDMTDAYLASITDYFTRRLKGESSGRVARI